MTPGYTEFEATQPDAEEVIERQRALIAEVERLKDELEPLRDKYESLLIHRDDWVREKREGQAINAELVAALKDALPYVKAQARFAIDKRAVSIVQECNGALSKAERGR